MTLPGDLVAQQLLDAMDGVAYLVDAGGVVLAIGNDAWRDFADRNSASWLTPEAVIGTSLFSHVYGSDVQAACRRFHDAVCLRSHAAITYEYRCDAPGVERHMHMAIRPVRNRSGSVMALYQSQMVTDTSRLPLGLLSFERRATPGLTYRCDELVVLCSYCHDVAWPVGAEDPDRIWIKIEEYYRRSGPADVVVTHGVCPACLERLVAASE